MATDGRQNQNNPRGLEAALPRDDERVSKDEVGRRGLTPRLKPQRRPPTRKAYLNRGSI